MLKYKVIEIFTSEEARWQGKPLSEAVVQHVRDLKIAARCIVTRGTDGCYESGEVATKRLEILSYNMPVRICTILPATEFARVLPDIEKMVTEGIVAVHDLEVVSHKTRGSLIPRQIRVRDAMTPDPQTVAPETPLNEVIRLLLSAIFTGLPVVGADNRPIGVISQGDLIYRAGMPLRLGLLAASDEANVGHALQAMAHKNARDIMSSPAVSIEEDKPLTDGVKLMLKMGLKRLPVVDTSGRLVGIISRMDIFRTIMKESPDWKAFTHQSVRVENLRFVSDIMRRDTHAVSLETPIEEVIGIIDSNDIQRVAVVDRNGRYLGLISDEDLLSAFCDQRAGFWDYLVSRMSFTEVGRKHKEFIDRLKAKTISEIMDTKHATVREDTTIEEAVRIMTEKGLKRLPVLDSAGSFTGMVSRESLLRTGFAHP